MASCGNAGRAFLHCFVRGVAEGASARAGYSATYALRQFAPWGGLVTDGSRIYFVIRDVPGWNLMQTSVEGGSSQETSTPFDNTRIIDLSPDHSQFLIGHRTKVKRQLVELRGQPLHLYRPKPRRLCARNRRPWRRRRLFRRPAVTIIFSRLSTRLYS